MNLDLGKKLFPNASPWQRQRWMWTAILGTITALVLVAGVAYFMIKISHVGGPRPSGSLKPLKSAQPAQ